jgi:two-component system CheB/CheR fusion protein
MKTNKAKPGTLSPNAFPVVGIGASAGGLDAFKKLLTAIPEDSGMAYVLVQHLDPNHESLLPALLQKVTKIPVLEISDDIKVLADHIYIIPSNKMLVATDGILKLSPRAEKGKRNLPIDIFFASLAEVHQAFAIGVVLSGTGSDGTKGLRAIKEQGGITFAQDEASAAYPEMPANAVQAAVVDFILSPGEIPGKLAEIKERIGLSDKDIENAAPREEDVFKKILSLLRLRKGTDFTYYKQTTIRRRILRRMLLNKNEETEAYLLFLQKNKTEQDALYQDLLIPVTAFFRDEKVFEHLCESVFPRIAKNKAPGEPIRIWVAGCSTGNEAYSIAVCLKEFLGTSLVKAQVFATDISEPAIIKARAGIYKKSETEGITAQRLGEFFTKKGDTYQVNKEVRDMCVFAVHNFLKDPPFGKIDMVSCRNVLIYMEAYLQKKALTTFHYALNPKGFLLLGRSETTAGVAELFAATGKNYKLFSRKDSPGRFMQVTTQRSEKILHELSFEPSGEKMGTDFQKTADDIMLRKYTPAGVVVNEAMDIVHFRGNTGAYLEQAPGKPSHNLIKMAKNGLAFELRNILHKSKKENTAVSKNNIPLQVNGSQHLITIEAIPLHNIVEPHYLVLFHDNFLNTNNGAGSSKTATKIKKDAGSLRIQELETELMQTREDMRSITEEQEAANEELQSANEELLSGSEELQSLNEELETSKEELQSSNEELISLNEQISAARHYAESIVATLREPVLVLDMNLRVKTANSAFYTTFRTQRQDTEGVMIYDLGNRQWNIPQLRTLLEEILPKKTVITDFEVMHDFPLLGERAILLNARELTREKTEEKLILLSIEDITERKQFLQKETELSARFRNLVMTAPVAICILNGKDYTMELANDYYLQLIDKKNNIIGKPFFEALPELVTQGIKEILDSVLQNGTPYFGNELELNIQRNKKVERGFYNFVYQPIKVLDKTTGIIVVANEVTDQVIARKRMEVQAIMVQDLLMTAPGFVCTLTGPKHVYGLVNDRYQQLFGKRKIKGKAIMEALPELEGQGFDLLLDKVYRTGIPYVGIENLITLARDEGLVPEDRYFNFSYQPMYDENKLIYSILVFGYEVTDQVNARNKIREIQEEHSKELEEKVWQRTLELSEANELLNQKNNDLKKMNVELESFTFISSHDLQEPLRKIQTFAERILENDFANLSVTGKDYFNRMHSAASLMQTLIEDLLAYSHAGIVGRQFERVDLAKIMKEVSAEFSMLITEKKAVIIAEELDELYVNRPQFKQVITNLLANSLKFARQGVPPQIVIKTRIGSAKYLQDENPELPAGRLSPKHEYCHISFSDNGIGFDPQYKTKIFEMFQRLHSKEEYPGTGIGLSIVKKIIENHKGFIRASGVLNTGAVFDIYIPATT